MQINEWSPSPEFLIYYSISKPFCHQRKALDLPKKMRYILWMVALGACDVRNDGRHLGRHPRFYQELEIRLKPRGMKLFWYLTWKLRHK